MQLQGVTTTGIYCRADCKARPDPRNVRPMRSAVEALARGFRPCLLCRPDRLPGPGPDPAPAEVAHALRLIAEGYLDAASTGQLAARVGYSPRHLVRLFAEHVGASPDFVARARRAHLARRLLDESDLPITRIAFAAGFASVRQMNRVMHELFGFAPSGLRARRLRGDALASLDGGLRLRVPYRGALAGRLAIAWLGTRPIPGVEVVEAGRYRRTLNTCGFPGVVDVTDPCNGRELEVTLHLATFGSILEQVERVRALFGLETDGTEAERQLERDALLGPLVRRRPGLRLLGAWDRFETLARIVIGQQVSVAGAATVTGRLAERYGEAIDATLPGGLCRLFPAAEVLAAADPRRVFLPEARGRTLVRLAAAVASGELDLTRVAPLDESLAALQALPGIGPWSAQLIAGRILGAPDAFPAGDLGLRRVVARLLGRREPCPERELAALAERWRPHRATAAAYLWTCDLEPAAPAARGSSGPTGEAQASEGPARTGRTPRTGRTWRTGGRERVASAALLACRGRRRA